MGLPHTTLPDLNTLDHDSLKALILSQHDEMAATKECLQSRESAIEHLKLLLAKLQRMQFVRKSKKSDTSAAIRYALARWDALVRFIDDGRFEIDNNSAERALRAVAIGR